MGVCKIIDFIEKLIWGLVVFMVVCSVFIVYFVFVVYIDFFVIMEEVVKEGVINLLNVFLGFVVL